MPEWTEAQRNVIESDAGEIICSAAAGSGKTAVMVERIARLIRAGGGLRGLPGIWLTWAVILGVALFAAVRRRPGALPSARTPVSLGVRLLN